jgi:hypothetical protein
LNAEEGLLKLVVVQRQLEQLITAQFQEEQQSLYRRLDQTPGTYLDYLNDYNQKIRELSEEELDLKNLYNIQSDQPNDIAAIFNNLIYESQTEQIGRKKTKIQ